MGQDAAAVPEALVHRQAMEAARAPGVVEATLEAWGEERRDDGREEADVEQQGREAVLATAGHPAVKEVQVRRRREE